MGYAGNVGPQFIVPTLIANREENKSGGRVQSKSAEIADLDFFIGDLVKRIPFFTFVITCVILQAQENSTTHQINYPIGHGLIEHWDNMEKMWQRSIYKYLRCEPDEHYFLLTEPPLNPPVCVFLT